MEGLIRTILLVILNPLLISLTFAVESREVVLLGKVKSGLQIVATREIKDPSRYQLFSKRGMRAGRDHVEELSVELWGATHLLGKCQAVQLKKAFSNNPLQIELRCTSVKKPALPQQAWLRWDKKEKGRMQLRLRSWLSGKEDAAVKVEYDAIRG